MKSAKWRVNEARLGDARFDETLMFTCLLTHSLFSRSFCSRWMEKMHSYIVAYGKLTIYTYISFVPLRRNKFTWKIIQINREIQSIANHKLKTKRRGSAHRKNFEENSTAMFIKSVLCFPRFIVYTYSSSHHSLAFSSFHSYSFIARISSVVGAEGAREKRRNGKSECERERMRLGEWKES